MLSEFKALNNKFCDITEHIQCFLANTFNYNNNRIRQASIDRDLRNGKPGVYGTIFSDLKDHETEVFNLNHFKAKCDAIYGNQLNNVKSILAIPSDDGIQETADDWTSILLKVQQEDKTQSKISDVFNNSLTSGMELFFCNIELDSDLTNKITTKHIPYNQFNIDNSFLNLDLSDCKYINKWGYITKTEARYLLPDYREQIEEILACSKTSELYTPSNQIGKILMDEFWYLDYRKALFVKELNTQKCFEWSGSQDELNYYLSMRPNVITIEHVIPTIRLAISLNKTIFYDEWNPFKIDRYPFALFVCNFEKTLKTESRTYGFIRNLRGSGYLGARSQTLLWKNLEKQIYEKCIYKPTSLVNEEDVQIPGFDKHVAIRREESIGDVQIIPQGDISAQVSAFSSAMNQEMQITSGVNEAIMGSSDDDSGIKMLFRQGAGLNIQAPIFHNLDIAMQNVGEIFYELIRINYSYEKITMMLNNQPTIEFYTKIFGKYRIEIVQGTNTTTQKVIQAKQLIDLSKAGVPIDPMDIFDAYPLQGKSDIRKKAEAKLQQSLQQQQQQAQIEAAQLEQSMQLKQAEIDALRTTAQYNVSKSHERESKASENITHAAANVASAQKDRSQEFLNITKAINDIKCNFEKTTQLIEKIDQAITNKEVI